MMAGLKLIPQYSEPVEFKSIIVLEKNRLKKGNKQKRRDSRPKSRFP